MANPQIVSPSAPAGPHPSRDNESNLDSNRVLDRMFGPGSVADRYRRVRGFTESLCANLDPEDCVGQSMENCSPAKWHLAHTTWFFETFVLQEHVSGYESFHPAFGFLFNSYYNGAGERHARTARGLLSRPALPEVLAYRNHVISFCLIL